ncbi:MULTISPECIES: hypothetical protein [unclassified Paenibacillus]|uniref:hypothetical protein n=1 Tax=unclassified Paenibacillus TaxID=185978 RepID=UPI001AE1DFC8|nr:MULTISPECIES: hypothetical protein [unclassified Paenibacillus]MBP1157419.1 hypothetical protein [Paenibacillus sp. PvP091]MBP1171843.1 hypothetical protein [Paenibacillus sp. PvR098]MBP2438224.1 hypothetical protein [Paenibacillus sp. PvP052]
MNPIFFYPVPDDSPLTEYGSGYSESASSLVFGRIGAELKGKVAQNIVDVLPGFYPAYLANPDAKGLVDLRNKLLIP